MGIRRNESAAGAVRHQDCHAAAGAAQGGGDLFATVANDVCATEIAANAGEQRDDDVGVERVGVRADVSQLLFRTELSKMMQANTHRAAITTRSCAIA